MKSADSIPYAKELERAYNSHRPLRTFLGLLSVSPAGWFWVCLLYFLKALPLYLAPLVLAEAIRIAETQPPGGGEYITLVFSAYVFTLIANIPLHAVFIRSVSRYSRSLELRLRAALVRRLQHLSMQFHVNKESGRLQAKVLRDVEQIIQMADLLFQAVIGIVLSILWSFSVTLYQDWRVAIVFVFLSPITILLIRFFRKRIMERNREYRQELESMSQRINEMIDLVPVTRAHGAEEFEINEVEHRLRDVYAKGRNLDRTNAYFASSSFVIFHLAVASVLIGTTVFVLLGHMPLSHIALYHGLFTMLVMGVNQLSGMIPQITRSLESVSSLGEVMESPDFEENIGKPEVPEVGGLVRYENVHYKYADHEKHAVENFHFEARPGDCVAIVGESGSGKSTLLLLTIGFLRPKSGEIYLDGRPMSEIDMRTYRRHIAVVPQHTILFSGNIRQNITYGMNVFTEEQIWEALDAANLRSVIEQLPDGLDTRVGEQGFKLSGGQRQRLAIARAIIRDPKVIILDEATSALDVISEKQVQEALERLVEGRTTFIVAHRLSTIRQANKIIVMKDGRAVEMGTAEELMAQGGEFARLKALQA